MQYGKNCMIECRDVLFINKNGDKQKKEDATFIMMNSGSSEPKDEKYEIPEYTIKQVIKNGVPEKLVPTKPDEVQYYVMKLMDDMNWNKVKVINLSDIRDANSDSLKCKICEFEKTQSKYNKIHSIFSKERSLNKNIIDKSKPVVCSCGVDNPNYLTECAIEYIKNNDIELIGKKKETLDYFYLNPRGGTDICEDLAQILKQE